MINHQNLKHNIKYTNIEICEFQDICHCCQCQKFGFWHFDANILHINAMILCILVHLLIYSFKHWGLDQTFNDINYEKQLDSFKKPMYSLVLIAVKFTTKKEDSHSTNNHNRTSVDVDR